MAKEEPKIRLTVRTSFESLILREFERGKVRSPDSELDALRSRSAKFEKILNADDDFYVLYRSANIAATWLSVLAAALFEEFTDSTDPDDEQAVAMAFFSRLANDLWAIIELVEAGFDLQARALGRSYLEHVDSEVDDLPHGTLDGGPEQAPLRFRGWPTQIGSGCISPSNCACSDHVRNRAFPEKNEPGQRPLGPHSPRTNAGGRLPFRPYPQPPVPNP